MKDVRSFLRYILPGLVFSIWLLISLLISDTDKTICFLKEVSDKEIIGVIATTFLASGALGYIFSVIYWARYWLKPITICKIKIIDDIAVDHKSLLKRLTMIGKIEIANIYGKRMGIDDLDKISKREAWVIFSQHWWTSRIKNETDKDKYISIDRLADITHAIGTALISIIFSLFVWAISHYWYFKSKLSISDVIVFLVQIPLILAFCKNYWDTHDSLQRLLNSAFANMLENQFKKTRRKITIYYSR